MARGSAGESVLHKHLRILDVFDAFRPFLTLREITVASGLAASSAHRLVSELEREGLLERMPDRSYRLGVRLWEFAARVPGALGLRESARPWLSAVHGRVRQHTQLGIRQGTDVLFIDRMSFPDAVVNATIIGGRIPQHASSSGLALLAHADDEVVQAVTESEMRSYTRHTIRTPAELRSALRRVRADGYAITRGHIHLESCGIAVPIFGPGGEVYAGMGVVISNDDRPVQPIIELLTYAANGVTRDLARAYADPHGMVTPPGVSLRSQEYFASTLGRSGPSSATATGPR